MSNFAYPVPIESGLASQEAVFLQERRRGSLHAITTGQSDDVMPADPSRMSCPQFNELLTRWYTDPAVVIAGDIFQGAFSLVPFNQEKLKKGIDGEIPRIPLDDEYSYPMLALRTNQQGMTYSELLSTIAFWWQFTRRAYVAIEPMLAPNGKTRYGFFPMHSYRVIPVQTKDGIRGYLYDISANGTGNARSKGSLEADFIFYPRESVIAIKGPSPVSPLYPMSMATAIETTSAASRFATTAAKELYRTSAAVQGVLYTSEPTDPVVVDLQRQFASTWGPGLNRKRLAVLNSSTGDKLEPWKTHDTNSSLVNTMSQLSTAVANLLGVPPALLDPTSKTQDTIQSAEATFWSYRILPAARQLAEEITRVMCVGRQSSVIVSVAERKIPQLALLMLNHTKTIVASMNAGLRLPSESRDDAGYGGYPEYIDEETAKWSRKPMPLTDTAKAGDPFGNPGAEGGQSRPGGSDSVDTSLKKSVGSELRDFEKDYELPHASVWEDVQDISGMSGDKQAKAAREFFLKLGDRLKNS